jgi:hypothetical protein
VIALLLAAAMTFTPNVQHARDWLRDRTSERAFHCAHVLWANESHWSVHARTGKAYGIPQAYPGRRMRSAGRNWRNSATVQVRWGTGYARGRYGGFCAALRFQDRNGWY